MATNRGAVYTSEQLQCLEVNLDNLEKAAKCLFNNDKHNPSELNKLSLESDVNFAHQWLLWVQKSKDAWQMVWFILNTSTQSQPGVNPIPEVSPEVQYFGANTLQFKIQKHLRDLSDEEVVNLRDKLLALITQQSSQMCPKFVRTRLLVCLASLIIRTVGDTYSSAGDLWGEGGDAIGQLVSLFSSGQMVQSLDAHSRLNILLQLLTFVPEEYATSFLTKRHRNSLFKYCREKGIPCTLSLVTSLLKVDSTSVEQRCAALNMINAWCQFGISLPDNIELLQLLYNHLLRIHPSEVDSDFTCELFNTLGHLIGQPVSAKCINTFFHFLLPMTFNTQQQNVTSPEGRTMEGSRTSLRQLIEEVLQNGEDTTVNAVCGYLLSLADTYCNSIVMPPINAMEQLNENCFRALTLCEMVLKFTAKQGHYPVEETCSSLTFAFWYNLQEDIPVCISVISDSSPGSVDANAKVILERHCSNLMTVMTQLIVVLSHKCEYPPKEVLDKWTSDEIEQLRCYRIDCNDYIASLQTLFGVEILGQTLLQIYLSVFAQVHSASSPDSVPWQKIEAPLYLLSGCNLLGEAPECGVVASPVLTTLPQVMTIHPKIMESCCDFIGQLAIWMCEQHSVFYDDVTNNPTVLQNVVRMLCSSLDCEEDISVHAAMALKEIAAASVTELHCMAFEIFSKVKPILHKEVVPKLSLLENLVFAVGKSISALDNQQIIQITDELLKPHSERLLKFLQSSPGDISNMHNSLVDSSGPEAALMQKMRVNATVSAAHIWLALFAQLVVSIDVGDQEDSAGGAIGGDVDDHDDCGWVRPGNEPDPCIVLLEQVDPVIKLLMDRFASKDTIVCDICGLYKRTYYNIKHRTTKISPQICSYTLKFLSVPSPGLNHPTSVLHMFTTQNVLPSPQIAQSVVHQAFQIIVTNYFNSHTNSHYSDPDFLAEVFYWIQDLCKDNGYMFELFKQSIAINEELLAAVFKLILAGLKVQESMAFRNCLGALTEFAKNSVVHSVMSMQNCIIQSMAYIVDSVCEALAGITYNMNGVDAYASLLLHLNRGYSSVLEPALKNCLSDSKFNSTHGSEADMSYFISNVLKEKSSKSNMRETCSNFSTACIGTQSTLSKGMGE